jgi:hypothetical protein
MHRATKGFWDCYKRLPPDIRKTADKNFKLLKKDPSHPSLQFKKIRELCSVRIGLHYRALGLEEEGFIYWFWIGHHREYDKLIRT